MDNIDSFQGIIQWIQSPDAGKKIIRWIKQDRTDWVPWKEREKLAGFDGQGLYFIAEPRPDKTDGLSSSIVCIGQTSRTFRERLNEFDQAAFKGKEGHGPGIRHHKRCDCDGSAVYVSILPLKLEQSWRYILPPFLEGIVHSEYKKVNRDLPEDNQHSKNKNEFGEPSPRSK